jgi:hypothetical protein
MPGGKGWDLTSLHSLASACEWIRKGSGALFVVAVRSGVKEDDSNQFVFDSAIAADPNMPIRDILPRLEIEVAGLTLELMRQREAGEKRSDHLSATKQSQR